MEGQPQQQQRQPTKYEIEENTLNQVEGKANGFHVAAIEILYTRMAELETYGDTTKLERMLKDLGESSRTVKGLISELKAFADSKEYDADAFRKMNELKMRLLRMELLQMYHIGSNVNNGTKDGITDPLERRFFRKQLMIANRMSDHLLSGIYTPQAIIDMIAVLKKEKLAYLIDDKVLPLMPIVLQALKNKLPDLIDFYGDDEAVDRVDSYILKATKKNYRDFTLKVMDNKNADHDHRKELGSGNSTTRTILSSNFEKEYPKDYSKLMPLGVFVELSDGNPADDEALLPIIRKMDQMMNEEKKARKGYLAYVDKTKERLFSSVSEKVPAIKNIYILGVLISILLALMYLNSGNKATKLVPGKVIDRPKTKGGQYASNEATWRYLEGKEVVPDIDDATGAEILRILAATEGLGKNEIIIPTIRQIEIHTGTHQEDATE